MLLPNEAPVDSNWLITSTGIEKGLPASRGSNAEAQLLEQIRTSCLEKLKSGQNSSSNHNGKTTTEEDTHNTMQSNVSTPHQLYIDDCSDESRPSKEVSVDRDKREESTEDVREQILQMAQLVNAKHSKANASITSIMTD